MTKIDYSGNSNTSLDTGSNRPDPSLRHLKKRVAQTGETLVNRAASGAMAQDQAWAGITIQRAATDTKFVIICDVNDARFVTPARIDRYKQFIWEMICQSAPSVRKAVASSLVVKTGAWSATQVLPSMSMLASTIGAKLSTTVDGSAIYVTTLVDNTSASQGSKASVYCDGLKVGEVTSDNVGVNTISGGNTYIGLRWGPATFRFVVPDGTHGVEVVNETAKSLHVASVSGNAGQIESPAIEVGNGYALAPLGATNFALPSTTTALFRDAVEEVVKQAQADGFQVSVLDTYKHTFTCMPDGLHWAVDDHLWVAEKIEATFNSVIPEQPSDPQVMTMPMIGGNVLRITKNVDDLVCAISIEAAA